MKSIYSFLLAVLFAATTFAQGVSVPDYLINRVDAQNGERWQHSVNFTIGASTAPSTPVLLDKVRPAQKPAQQNNSFSISFPSQTIEFTGGGVGNVKAHLINTTDSTIRLVFRRWQTLPNEEWNSSVCFGDACYIYFVDSLPWGNIEFYEFPARAEAEFKLAVFAPEGANDSMSAYIRIQAINTTDDDSIGFFLVAKAIPLESISGSNTKTNFKIESVYPSPLVSGSSLKVKLSAPQNAGYTYAIFDNLGREVAYGSTRQHLLVGDNTVEITSLEGLVTGSYLLRVKFNGGGSDAIPFQVIR